MIRHNGFPMEVPDTENRIQEREQNDLTGATGDSGRHNGPADGYPVCRESTEGEKYV
ncbi:MAG: hypothetical protein K2P59_16080 [Acetatifactor sp.]|nr:hypothetical protein [Acetatifactor sp.]